MKKTLTVILVALLLCTLFSCAKKTTPSTPVVEEKVAEPKVTVEKEEVKEEKKEEKVEVKVEPPKELTIDEKLVANKWCFKYTAEGYGDYAFFFHFYPEDEVLGSVYYAGFTNNKQNFAGLYEIKEETYNYEVYLSREDSVAKINLTPGSVPYTIILKDWDGNETGRMGFDGERVVNAQDKNKAKIYATGSTPYYYEKDTPDFASVVAGEMPIPFLEFVAKDDVTSTIQINHNHSYTDLVAAMIEGTWKAEKGDDGIKYVLTPNDKTDTPAVLAVSADGKSALYTPEGDEAIEMVKPEPEVTVVIAFEGKTPTSYGKDATVTIECLSDGTFTLVGSIFGQNMTFDQGTWTVNHAQKYTFVADNAGTFQSAIVDRSIVINYALAGTKLGDITAELKNK